MGTALLVIDMQKMFYKGKTKGYMDNAVENIMRKIDKCRKSNQILIWIQHSRKTGKLKKGNTEYEIIESLRPNDDEVKIEKTFSNSFIKTKLKDILDENKIDRLILCGYKAEACVLHTFLGAKKLGYDVSVVKNGTASSSRLGIT
jgi:nicotinamidase-related amidase